MNIKTASEMIPRFPLITSVKNADKVIIFFVLSILSLFVIDSTQALDSVKFIIDAILYIAPFLLLAVCLAASIKASGADKMIVNVFTGNPLKTVLVASVFGAISPFCSCGVIPLIASMLVAGVPLAPVMAFWIASPIMDPEMFILTSAGIGLNFAIFKAIFAIVLGLIAGLSVLFVQQWGGLGNILKSEINQSTCGAVTCGTGGEAINTSGIQWQFWTSPKRMVLFKQEFKQTAYFLGKWLILAFFFESLMVAYIEPDWIREYISGDSFLVIPLAALIGMPSYLNGYAAIPLVGELINMGMSSGAAMAFMLAGAVSSIPAAIAVYALVKFRVFMLYLSIGLAGSIICGFVFSMIA